MNINVLRRCFHRSHCRMERMPRFDHARIGFGHDGQKYSYTDRCWILTCAGSTVCLLWSSDLEGK